MEQNTHDTLPPSVEWPGGKRKQEPRRLTTDLAAETMSGRVAPATSPDYESLSGNTSLGHGRNGQLYDVGP